MVIQGVAMINSHKFLKSVLDTVTQNIAVIDKDGQIVYVNKSNNYSIFFLKQRIKGDSFKTI